MVIELEQRLQRTEKGKKQEVAQHQAQLKDQKGHINYIQNMFKMEVLTHKQKMRPSERLQES